MWSNITHGKDDSNKVYEDFVYYSSIQYSLLDWDRLLEIYREMLERGELE